MKVNKIGGGIAVVLAATLAVSALSFSGITAVAAEDTDLTGNTMLKADEMELKKALEKLLIEDQETQKAIKAILEFFQKMTEDASQVVKDKAQAQINVMSMAPTGGMA